MGVPSVNDWLDMMPETVTFNAFVSRSVSGEKTYNEVTTLSYRARIEMKNHLTVDMYGRTVTARGRVFLATTVVPNVEDRMTLPGVYQPTRPPMIAVNSTPDDTGTHHVVIEVG